MHLFRLQAAVRFARWPHGEPSCPAASSGATYYELYRSTSSTFSIQALEYSGPDLWAFVNVSTTTYFRVRACNASGCSGYRNGDRAAQYFHGCL